LAAGGCCRCIQNAAAATSLGDVNAFAARWALCDAALLEAFPDAFEVEERVS
jgi:hypothetical protein